MDIARNQGSHPADGSSQDSSSISSTMSPTVNNLPYPAYPRLQTAVSNATKYHISPLQQGLPPLRNPYNTTSSISPSEGLSREQENLRDNLQEHAQENNRRHSPSSHLGSTQKRAYRQRRKDPSCDACRERKVKCDASENLPSCSECSGRQVSCEFTKETNRRMSTIKQVQDLERQLRERNHQMVRLRAMASKHDNTVPLSNNEVESLQPHRFYRRRKTQPTGTNYSTAISNLRKFGEGLVQLPNKRSDNLLCRPYPRQAPPLPSRLVAEELVERYETCMHHRFPVIDWNEFVTTFRTVYENREDWRLHHRWIKVFFCVLACGTLYTLDLERQQEGREYLRESKAQANDWTNRYDLSDVQVALLSSIFLIEINLKEAGLISLATAVRISHLLQLHLEDAKEYENRIQLRIWCCVATWDLLLSLELGTPPLVQEEYRSFICACESNNTLLDNLYPAPFALTRFLPELLHILATDCIPSSVISQWKVLWLAVNSSVPAHLNQDSLEPLDPQSIQPVIYIHSAHFMFSRHNLSPVCSHSARSQALEACLMVARSTAALLFRCNITEHPGRAKLGLASSTILCTHLWRCTLVALMLNDTQTALTLLTSLSIAANTRRVGKLCGIHIEFFLNQMIERLKGDEPFEPIVDEELLVYASADMQSSMSTGWLWPELDEGSNPIAADAAHNHSASDAETYAWDGWENLKLAAQYLHTRRQEGQGDDRSSLLREKQPPARPSARVDSSSPEASTDQTKSRMTIANIIGRSESSVGPGFVDTFH